MNKKFYSHNDVEGFNDWFHDNPSIFHSAVGAIREMLPTGKKAGVEICCGTDIFSRVLGIPCCNPPHFSKSGNVSPLEFSIRENEEIKLPFEDLQMDYVLFSHCDNPLEDIHSIFKEAYRSLKINGVLVVAFIDSKSPAGMQYTLRLIESRDYKNSIANLAEKIMFELSLAGFKHFEFIQTLFTPPGEIIYVQRPKPGYGEGAFVVVQARKKI